MAELIITHSDGRTYRRNLAGTVVLGRDPGCDVLLDDLGTSRRHARIRPDGDGFVVEDLGSKNGTLVNQAGCVSAKLRDGDEITLGTVRVVFSDRAAQPDMATSVVVSDETPPRAAATFSGRGEQRPLSQDRLQILYNLAGRLTRLRSRDELLEEVLDVCFEMLAFERGAIAVRSADRRTVEWPVVRNLRGAGGELTISRTVLSRALDHGERAVINDTGAADFDPTVSIVQLGIRSAMCVPLQHHDEILGVLYGDRTSAGAAYTEQDVDFLSGLAQLVSIGLINARLMEEQRAKLRLEHEIHLARGIQQRLFPASLPDRDEVKVAVLNDPGRHVSGDYYDVIELDRGRIAILIADVSGEGVAAALLMANLQAAVRVSEQGWDDLSGLVGRWNRLLHDNTDASKFVTALVGIVDPAARSLSLVNAGHPRPYLCWPQSGTCEAIEAEAGFPLGVVEGADYPAKQCELGTGPCTLFCYTDGVIEAMDEQGDQFTTTRMIEVLQSTDDPHPSALIRRMRSRVEDFCKGAPQSDDITMLAVQLP